MPLYFAYGSNLAVEQMYTRCPSARVVSVGCLREFRLDFTRYSSGWGGGVADVLPDKNCEVWGLVFEVSEAELKTLDTFEGVPTAYIRFEVCIYTTEGNLPKVWVYAVREKQPFTPPTTQYMRIIKHAAMKWQFPTSYCDLLDRFETHEY